jgi:type 1 fimbria pilin
LILVGIGIAAVFIGEELAVARTIATLDSNTTNRKGRMSFRITTNSQPCTITPPNSDLHQYMADVIDVMSVVARVD